MSFQSISRLLARLSKRFSEMQKTLSGSQLDNFASSASRRTSPSADNLIPVDSQKTDWWARLYRGLVMDSTARHYRQMKIAIWLFLYFLLNANWKSGTLYRRLSTISADTGINLFALRRWLRILVRNGYVNAFYNGRFWVITVNKWRPLESLLTRKSKSAKSASRSPRLSRHSASVNESGNQSGY